MIGHIWGWAAATQQPSLGEMIMAHVTDSHEMEVPFSGVIELPRWRPFHVGNVSIDLSPTKHVVMMLLAAVLLCIVMIWTARRTHGPRTTERAPRGFSNMMEAFVIFLRDEVVLANIGHGGERYVPYVLTLFFFILFANLLGLLPWGSTATGNLSVTTTLAVLSLILIEVSGFRTLGAKGYARTIFYAPEGMGPVGRTLMLMIMTPVELIGKIAKPFALAIRLFANMNAGHFVILALIGLVVSAGRIWWTGIPIAPLGMAIAIMLLELFVAFLQAYIFAMLTSVFIGLIRHAH